MVKISCVVLAVLVAVINGAVVKNEPPRHIHPRLSRQNTVGPEAELKQEYWKEYAMRLLEDHLARTEKKQRAKNIIMFLGDGMSLATLAAARTYMGQMEGRVGENDKLSFEKFPVVGLSNTYCVNAQVADSACSATAYLGGVKTNDGTIGVAAAVPYMNCSAMTDEENFVKSIAHQSLDVGKSAGIVTTTRITHASPSGAYAHTSCRDWESDADVLYDNEDPSICRDIAYQLVMNEPGNRFQVILGGGRRKFLTTADGGQRVDGVDLVNSWVEDKTRKNVSHQYVQTKAELLSAVQNDNDYIFGLFQSDHMNYHLLAPETQPTLEDMTDAAIKILSKNAEGFFLFVEGGRIDHAHHATLPHIALDETVEMAKAVEKALELTDPEDTLIVVTSDHSHTMTVAGYPSRGNDILGANDLDLSDDDLPYVTLSYANGPGYRKDTLDNGELKRVDITKDPQFIARNPQFVYPGMVPLSSETHGGEDVAVYAFGPWQHIFTGSYEQNLIPYMMAYAACLDEDLYNCSAS